MSTANELARQLEAFRKTFADLKHEIGKRVVGQEEAVEGLLTALLAGGHVLLEGLPGTGKTLLARTLAEVLDASFHRIQCTPDLVPTDVIGTYVIMETPQGRRSFEFQRGPLFANIVLADQINRTMPKTQAALLEAMDERTISVSTESFELPRPYLIVATQNPLEAEGTYPLPEAEVDRFFAKVVLAPPTAEEMDAILQQTTGAPLPPTKKILDGPGVLRLGELIRQVALGDEVRRRAIALVAATQPGSPTAPPSVRRFVSHGAGPRGAQAMVLGAKVRAILAGRAEVDAEDIRAAAKPALRHRLALNIEGLAENIAPDQVLDEIVAAVK